MKRETGFIWKYHKTLKQQQQQQKMLALSWPKIHNQSRKRKLVWCHVLITIIYFCFDILVCRAPDQYVLMCSSVQCPDCRTEPNRWCVLLLSLVSRWKSVVECVSSTRLVREDHESALQHFIDESQWESYMVLFCKLGDFFTLFQHGYHLNNVDLYAVVTQIEIFFFNLLRNSNSSFICQMKLNFK